MESVIFDMDGVLVNSVTHKHAKRTEVVRDEFGMPDVDVDQLIGLNSEDKYDYLVEHGLDLEKDEFLAAFDRDIETVYTERVELLRGLESTLERLRNRSIGVALASASNRRRVELVVDRFQLGDALDAVVSADDVAGDSKPDPAIYLRAASLLDADPSNCLAVEDSTHGVTAAKRAGTYCVGYAPDDHPPQDLGRADEVVTTPGDLHSRIRALGERETLPSRPSREVP